MLDSNGNAMRTKYLPQIGEFIDRYGPSEGRYVSPITDNKPYPYDKRSLPYVEDPMNYHRYKIVGDFSKIQEYISNCPDTKVKAKIDAYVTKNYNGDYNKLGTYYGEIAKVYGWGSGGGVQYEFPIKIEWLIEIGLLMEIQ